jgi:hypothetical protein
MHVGAPAHGRLLKTPRVSWVVGETLGALNRRARRVENSGDARHAAGAPQIAEQAMAACLTRCSTSQIPIVFGASAASIMSLSKRTAQKLLEKAPIHLARVLNSGVMGAHAFHLAKRARRIESHLF